MKHVYVGHCPVCNEQRALLVEYQGRWDREQEPPKFVEEYVLLSAICDRHPGDDPGRRWKFPAGTDWVLTLDVKEDETHAGAGPDGV